MSSNRKTGYQRGVGRSFTPSQQAEWVEHFNRILNEESGWSRNRLTEHLIKEALRMRDPTYIHIPIHREGLTKEQIQFLKSEEGQRFVSNLIHYLLQTNQKNIPIPEPTETHTSSQELMEKKKETVEEEPSYQEKVETPAPSIRHARVRVEKRDDQQVRKTQQEKKKNSPMANLQRKLSMQENILNKR